MPLHRFAGTIRRNKHRDDRAHGRLQNPLAQNDVRAGEPSRRWEARWNKWKGQVDNPRFLILPWIKTPNLGSHILALIRRRLPDDWAERYNTTPVLIETFVETPRYTGAVYRASGWIHVGATQGRGRYDRDRQYGKPKKDVWLRPLRLDWKRTLNR